MKLVSTRNNLGAVGREKKTNKQTFRPHTQAEKKTGKEIQEKNIFNGYSSHTQVLTR